MNYTTKLVMFKDYDDDQQGYDAARSDGAIYPVEIDEASYSALYNVQQSIKAACECSGYDMPALGLERDGSYISLSVVEDGDIEPNIDYGDLEEAFELGLSNMAKKRDNLLTLRANVTEAMTELMILLDSGEEYDRVEHCHMVMKNAKAHLNSSIGQLP